MKATKKFLVKSIMAIAIIFVLSTAIIAAPADIMPVSEVKAGMKGIALTVMDGTIPEEFNIEVVAIMKNAGYLSDLILFRASGAVIEKSGGIISGMSGSPVYIGGKLVGAISHLLYQGSPNYGLITPIEDMLYIFDYMDRAEQLKIIEATKELEGKDVFVAPNLEEAEKVASTNAYVAVPVATPMVVTGLTQRGLDFLNKSLEKFNVVATSGSGSDNYIDAAIVPGSSIAVQISRGDVDLGAFGTVTYVDGNRFLAFGHSFFGEGNVNFIAAASSVSGVLRGAPSYSKIADSGQVVGSVTQDRLNGIGGTLGDVDFDMIPINLKVNSLDNGRSRTLNFEMIQNEGLIAGVVGSAMITLMDSVADRMGEGTATVLFELKLSNGTTFNRDNTFYSTADISTESAMELLGVIEMITNNVREYVAIQSIDVTIDMSSERKTARVLSATPSSERVRPGESVDIEIEILPYRQPIVKRTITVEIPSDLPEGRLELIVGVISTSSYGYSDYDISFLLEEIYAEEILILLEDVSRTYQNNYLQINPSIFISTQTGYYVSLGDGSYDEMVVAIETDWVIEGYDIVTLEIVTKSQGESNTRPQGESITRSGVNNSPQNSR